MRFVAALSLFAIAATAQEPSHSPIEGLWKNPAGTAIIAIEPCARTLCGKVVWASERGQREAAKGASNVVGTNVLSGLTRSGNRWSGNLFIPDDNMHVSARLQPVGARRMTLTGCVLAGLFCRSQTWTRFEGPLPAYR